MFGCKEHKKFDFSIDHLVTSRCSILSCIVEKGCLLWPVCSLAKSLFAYALLHFVLQGQIPLLFQVYLDFLLLYSSCLWGKGVLCVCVCVCVFTLESVVGLHRFPILLTNFHFFGISGWGIDINVMLNGLSRKEPRSLCHFWDCSQVLHFRLFCWLWGLLHFL